MIREMKKAYRRNLVRSAGMAGNWNPERFTARPGVTYLSLMYGVRIPRSMRYMVDRKYMP